MRCAPETIVFDLDETIYPRDAGVMQAIGHRITEYIELLFRVSREEALAMRRKYHSQHGTTLRGLQIHHTIDPDEYMEFVHDVPVEQLLQYNSILDEVLGKIDARKIIFTNASYEHAFRVLNALGIRRHFSRIIDVRDMGWESKPAPSAYTRLIELLGTEAQKVMLVEDNLRNLKPAAQLGMVTVLVDDHAEDGTVDFVIDEIWQIGSVYDQLRGLGGRPDRPLRSENQDP